MAIGAVFELPVPIWVMTDALGAAFPAGYGRLSFDVVMPSEDGVNGAPPAVPGLQAKPELVGADVRWVHPYAAFIPDRYKPATALLRIGITDVDGPTPDRQSWFTPEHQLAEYITAWFDAVRTWVEVITGQDLDPHHRVYDAEAVGAGLVFLDQDHDGAHGLRLTTPRVLPVPSREWENILRLVREGKEPPLEELLSRDARASQRRGADRRAVIEAATALEIALGRYVRARRDDLPLGQRRRLDKRGERAALGDYVDIAEQSELPTKVTYERLRWLNTLRNDAAHRGAAPTNWDAGMAVQVAIDFLGAHGRYSGRQERESDGGEFVLIESADAGDQREVTDGDET